MITNRFCDNCRSLDVCKVFDQLFKFDVEAKKDLGVDITLDACKNYLPLEEDDVYVIDTIVGEDE